jgi:hypothetical protein
MGGHQGKWAMQGPTGWEVCTGNKLSQSHECESSGTGAENVARAKGASINHVQQSRGGRSVRWVVESWVAEQADSTVPTGRQALGFVDTQGCPSLLSAYCCWSMRVGCQNLPRVWLYHISIAPAGRLADRALAVLA